MKKQVPAIVGYPLGANRGFTIVELLIVVVVIAVLAAISVVAYTGIQNRAHEAALASKESQARSKLEVYNIEEGHYPSSQGEFDTLIGQTPEDDYYTVYSSTAPYDTYAISTGDSDSDVAITCPAGFIVVPGSSHYGTSSFCVMQYEAKNVGGVATSQSGSKPWVNISQTNALAVAQTACDDCQLITEAQWMTIAANVLSVDSNWSGGSVGNGSINRGNSNGGVSLDGSNELTGVNKRTHMLTNGQVIWDFAGNVWEWTQGEITGGQPGLAGESSFAWKDYSNVSLQWNSLPSTSRPTGTLYSHLMGVGSLYSNAGDTGTRTFARGGNWDNASNAGVLALNLGRSPSGMGLDIGFRATR